MKPTAQLFFLSLLFVSCSSAGQDKVQTYKNRAVTPTESQYVRLPDPFSIQRILGLPLTTQISQYVRRIFQDKAGNFWFGTNGDGVCRFDGRNFIYYSTSEGFAGKAVRGIVQDKKGNIWFGTEGGLSCFNGKEFRNYTVKDGLPHNDIWSLLLDRQGTLWLGTMGGVCRFNPSDEAEGSTHFTAFPLPKAEVNSYSRFNKALVWSIYEDKGGNIWFGTDGAGVRKYDPAKAENGENPFTILTTKDGLADNNIGCILQDRTGTIWFGTREGGVSRYNPLADEMGTKKFTTFSRQEGLSSNFVWTLFEDKTGNLWLGTAGGGLCRYNPSTNKTGSKLFIHYSQNDGLFNQHIQSILQDRNGNLWLGTSGGVFRYDGRTFVNFTRNEGC